ncbi:hypothetical protein [Arthrobacter sp. A5]|uniref:hypothetical protein n=1 Tax=Arthrobacter sp. A5 TaxID=576926 RepID=UPI003DA90C82
MVNKPEQNPSGPSANDDDDAVWRDLVARLESPSAQGYSPEGLTDDSSGGSPAAGDGGTGIPEQRDYPSFSDFDPLGVSRRERRPGVRDSGPGTDAGSRTPADGPSKDPNEGAPRGPRDYAGDDPWPDDEGFVPAEPPPLSSVEPALMLAWTGALGGPLAVLLAALFWRDAPVTAIIAMIAVFVVSAGYLMFRLPSHREDDDDDGAVV